MWLLSHPAAGGDDGELRLLDADDGGQLPTPVLVSCSDDQTVRLWQIGGGGGSPWPAEGGEAAVLPEMLPEVCGSPVLRHIRTLSGHAHYSKALDATVRVWEDDVVDGHVWKTAWGYAEGRHGPDIHSAVNAVAWCTGVGCVAAGDDRHRVLLWAAPDISRPCAPLHALWSLPPAPFAAGSALTLLRTVGEFRTGIAGHAALPLCHADHVTAIAA
eukprot:gene54918-42284_t